MAEDEDSWDGFKHLEKGRFGVEESNVGCFLKYFFWKYYDKEMECNRIYHERYYFGVFNERTNGFEWYGSNFYTYEAVNKMMKEIIDVADMLEKDYDNPWLYEIKQDFSIIYMVSRDDPDYIKGNDDAVRNHVECVIDFYRRFVRRLENLMENNPETDIICIEGS